MKRTLKTCAVVSNLRRLKLVLDILVEMTTKTEKGPGATLSRILVHRKPNDNNATLFEAPPVELDLLRGANIQSSKNRQSSGTQAIIKDDRGMVWAVSAN